MDSYNERPLECLSPLCPLKASQISLMYFSDTLMYGSPKMDSWDLHANYVLGCFPIASEVTKVKITLDF